VAERLVVSPPEERIELREGSWGKDNDHSTWANERTGWIWPEIERMEARFADTLRTTSSDPLHQRALRQAARELLLASASDWPFLVTTGQAADYAVERFRSHVLRFHRACELARRGTADDEVELRSLEHADDPFPDVDPRDFAA
jgi:1,4-alpha-glucan branching enzyme